MALFWLFRETQNADKLERNYAPPPKFFASAAQLSPLMRAKHTGNGQSSYDCKRDALCKAAAQSRPEIKRTVLNDKEIKELTLLAIDFPGAGVARLWGERRPERRSPVPNITSATLTTVNFFPLPEGPQVSARKGGGGGACESFATLALEKECG